MLGSRKLTPLSSRNILRIKKANTSVNLYKAVVDPNSKDHTEFRQAIAEVKEKFPKDKKLVDDEIIRYAETLYNMVSKLAEKLHCNSSVCQHFRAAIFKFALKETNLLDRFNAIKQDVVGSGFKKRMNSTYYKFEDRTPILQPDQPVGSFVQADEGNSLRDLSRSIKTSVASSTQGIQVGVVRQDSSSQATVSFAEVSSECDTLTQEMEGLQSQIEALRQDKGVLESANAEIAKQVSALESQIEALAKDKGGLESANAEISAELRAAEAQNALSKSELSQLHAQYNQILSQLSESDAKLLEAEAKYQELEQKCVSFETQFALASQKADSLGQELLEADGRATEADRRATEAEGKAKELSAKVLQFQTLAKSQLASLKEQKEKLRQEIEQMNKDNGDFSSKINEKIRLITEQKVGLTEEQQVLRRENLLLRQELEEARGQGEREVAELISAKAALLQIQGEVRELQLSPSKEKVKAQAEELIRKQEELIRKQKEIDSLSQQLDIEKMSKPDASDVEEIQQRNERLEVKQRQFEEIEFELSEKITGLEGAHNDFFNLSKKECEELIKHSIGITNKILTEFTDSGVDCIEPLKLEESYAFVTFREGQYQFDDVIFEQEFSKLKSEDKIKLSNLYIEYYRDLLEFHSKLNLEKQCHKCFTDFKQKFSDLDAEEQYIIDEKEAIKDKLLRFDFLEFNEAGIDYALTNNDLYKLTVSDIETCIELLKQASDRLLCLEFVENINSQISNSGITRDSIEGAGINVKESGSKFYLVENPPPWTIEALISISKDVNKILQDANHQSLRDKSFEHKQKLEDLVERHQFEKDEHARQTQVQERKIKKQRAEYKKHLKSLTADANAQYDENADLQIQLTSVKKTLQDARQKLQESFQIDNRRDDGEVSSPLRGPIRKRLNFDEVSGEGSVEVEDEDDHVLQWELLKEGFSAELETLNAFKTPVSREAMSDLVGKFGAVLKTDGNTIECYDFADFHQDDAEELEKVLKCLNEKNEALALNLDSSGALMNSELVFAASPSGLDTAMYQESEADQGVVSERVGSFNAEERMFFDFLRGLDSESELYIQMVTKYPQDVDQEKSKINKESKDYKKVDSISQFVAKFKRMTTVNQNLTKAGVIDFCRSSLEADDEGRCVNFEEDITTLLDTYLSEKEDEFDERLSKLTELSRDLNPADNLISKLKNVLFWRVHFKGQDAELEQIEALQEATHDAPPPPPPPPPPPMLPSFVPTRSSGPPSPIQRGGDVDDVCIQAFGVGQQAPPKFGFGIKQESTPVRGRHNDSSYNSSLLETVQEDEQENELEVLDFSVCSPVQQRARVAAGPTPPGSFANKSKSEEIFPIGKQRVKSNRPPRHPDKKRAQSAGPVRRRTHPSSVLGSPVVPGIGAESRLRNEGQDHPSSWAPPKSPQTLGKLRRPSTASAALGQHLRRPVHKSQSQAPLESPLLTQTKKAIRAQVQQRRRSLTDFLGVGSESTLEFPPDTLEEPSDNSATTVLESIHQITAGGLKSTPRSRRLSQEICAK
ncbi:hypothetical protein DID78_04170 [Candidatus Marinamargulisbacteria bacterium SCGC AG-343-D04]|nr:hypothetical protein DID78_04170 [Candidatus Marinamargulisbacteria bacterium SCGC AG-343-D04]